MPEDYKLDIGDDPTALAKAVLTEVNGLKKSLAEVKKSRESDALRNDKFGRMFDWYEDIVSKSEAKKKEEEEKEREDNMQKSISEAVAKETAELRGVIEKAMGTTKVMPADQDTPSVLDEEDTVKDVTSSSKTVTKADQAAITKAVDEILEKYGVTKADDMDREEEDEDDNEDEEKDMKKGETDPNAAIAKAVEDLLVKRGIVKAAPATPETKVDKGGKDVAGNQTPVVGAQAQPGDAIKKGGTPGVGDETTGGISLFDIKDYATAEKYNIKTVS